MSENPPSENLRWGKEQLRAARAPKRDLERALAKLRARQRHWLLNGIEPRGEAAVWGIAQLQACRAPRRDLPESLARLKEEFARRQAKEPPPSETLRWGKAQLRAARAPKRDAVAGLAQLRALAERREREPLPPRRLEPDPLEMLNAMRAPRRDPIEGLARLQALAAQRAVEGDPNPSDNQVWGIAQLLACRAPRRDPQQGLARLYALHAERQKEAGASEPAAAVTPASVEPERAALAPAGLVAAVVPGVTETPAEAPVAEKHKAELRVVRGEKRTKKTAPKAAPRTAGLGWKVSVPLVALAAAAAALVVWRQEPDHNTTSPGVPQLHCPPFEGPDRPPDTLGTEDERGRVFQLRHLVEDEPEQAREDIAAVQKRDDPSVLSDEREALAVHVELCLSKAPWTEARRRGEAFLQHYPQSRWAAAIRRELRSPPEPFR